MGAMRSTLGILRSVILAVLMLFALASWGQTINAQITDGSGSGKYTFEIRVDGIADVQIRGNPAGTLRSSRIVFHAL
jgi:hypothetical protein